MLHDSYRKLTTEFVTQFQLIDSAVSNFVREPGKPAVTLVEDHARTRRVSELAKFYSARHKKMDMISPDPNGRVQTSRLPPVEATEDLSQFKLHRTDLLIRGLVDHLPKPDTIWSLDERAKWLRTAVCIFGLVYKDSDGEQRQIGVLFLPRLGRNERAGTQDRLTEQVL